MSHAAVTKRRREKARCWRSAARRTAMVPLPSSSKEQGRTTLGLRKTEVEWREVEGELFALPFAPPLLSHTTATAGSHYCASPSKAERDTMELRFCFSGPPREELMGGGRPVEGENAVEWGKRLCRASWSLVVEPRHRHPWAAVLAAAISSFCYYCLIEVRHSGSCFNLS
ncbi:uncharacterized protein DS421_20g695110 [Arachis hypogaea]|nr:uncharacterized protein DS421_20g695110 [Arachis hypogaea]